MKHLLLLILGVGLTFGSCSNDDEDATDDKKTETPIFVAGAGITDLEGNSYKTVIINYSTSILKSAAQQEWMAENLRATKYNDGTPIIKVENNSSWNNHSIAAFCWYNNDSVTYNSHGAIYNWNVVNSGKLCPQGWHVPSETEWNVLVQALGGNAVAGGKIKQEGTSHWNSPNADASNTSGFEATSTGGRDFMGGFGEVGIMAYWWSSTEYTSTNAKCAHVSASSGYMMVDDNFKRSGLSVRCIRD